LVDGRRVLVALQSGILRIFQADSGFMLASQATAILGGAPAVVNQDIYLPSSDGFVYHWRGTGLE
jgi:hypothetical protein